MRMNEVFGIQNYKDYKGRTMMKRIWFLFGIALLLALPVSDASAAPAFSDVDSRYWAYNEINYLLDKQIIRG
jgi:hypothetical protein